MSKVDAKVFDQRMLSKKCTEKQGNVNPLFILLASRFTKLDFLILSRKYR